MITAHMCNFAFMYVIYEVEEEDGRVGSNQ